MDDMEKYKRWMESARGVRKPTPGEVEQFRQKMLKHHPPNSIIGLIKVMRLDARGDYAGTKAYLSWLGLDQPSREDLAYFHQRIKRALLWRVPIAAIVAAAGWYFLWWAGLLHFR